MEATATGTPSPTVESLTSPTFDTPPGVYTAITVGARHACALTAAGEAVCWNVENSTQWETPPGPYTYITAEGDTSCAVSTVGEIACWLSPGSEWGVLPEEAPPGEYAAVSMDGRYACALTGQGEAVCWGPEDSTFPLPAVPPGSYTTISLGQFIADESSNVVGYLTACATTIEADLVCWQFNINGRGEQAVERSSGDYAAVHVYLYEACVLTVSGGVACQDWDGDNATRYTALAVGSPFACAITESGKIQCREHGIEDHSFGDGGTPSLMNASEPDAGRGYAAVSVWGAYACALTDLGEAVCWGTVDNKVARTDPAPGGYVAVTDGYGHTCALTDGGEAICWGSVENKVARPDPVPGRYVAVSDGDGHTCALTEVGEAICWGWNNFGQADVPEGRYAAISAGFASTCAITDGGEAVCWGAFRFGPAEEQYRAISAGYEAACALTDEGQPVCFGDWRLSEAPSGSFVAISVARTGDACALRADGEAVCWGERSRDGRLDPPSGPWAAIDAGDHHTCAIDATGEVVCWGDPSAQLPGAPAGRYVAVGTSGYEVCVLTDTGQVTCLDVGDSALANPSSVWFSDGSRALEISVGLNRTCVLTDAGAAVCWGDTEYWSYPHLIRHGYQPRRW